MSKFSAEHSDRSLPASCFSAETFSAAGEHSEETAFDTDWEADLELEEGKEMLTTGDELYEH